MDKPAVLGGRPVFNFNDPLNITYPFLPEISEIQASLEEIFKTGMLTNGKYVREFEIKCAQYLGVGEAVAVSSATSALILAEKALELTGEVIVPSFTFSATVHSLLWNGLKPVFVDCLPQSYNLDPTAVEKAITARTSGILAVYIFGNPPDIAELEGLAKKYGLKLIFDSAQAFGSKYRDVLAGRFGEAEIFSLTPTKTMTTGEGGLITTNNPDLSERLRLLRNYGNEPDYDCRWVGLNARMLEFSAILGLKNLEKTEEVITRRNRLALRYQNQLSCLCGIQFQQIAAQDRSCFKDFSILIDEEKFALNRDQLALALAAENIQTRKYFYPPIHLQKAYQGFYPNGNDLATTMRVSTSILCLPFFTRMEDEELDKVVLAIQRIHSYASSI